MHLRSILATATAALVTLAASDAAKASIIVNISGSQSGEETGGADCTVACQGALINPVQVTLGAGTYSISDAWSPTNGLAPGALYDAWNFQVGNGQSWAWHWKALLDDGSAGSTISQANYASHILLDVDAAYPADAFTSESIAANFGYNTPAQLITLSGTTTLDFVVNDYYLGDNLGGVSLAISAVPLPAALPLFGTALVGLIGLARRSRSVTPA